MVLPAWMLSLLPCPPSIAIVRPSCAPSAGTVPVSVAAVASPALKSTLIWLLPFEAPPLIEKPNSAVPSAVAVLRARR